MYPLRGACQSRHTAFDPRPADTHPIEPKAETMRSEIPAVSDSPAQAPSIPPSPREPFGRFRRSREDAPPAPGDSAAEDEMALQLQVMLLSEDNARLKAELRRPSDVGTLIEQMRELGDQEGPGEVLDEAWTMLSECLVMRQGLEQACIEIQAAIGSVRERLGSLTVRLDGVAPAGAGHPEAELSQSSPAR